MRADGELIDKPQECRNIGMRLRNISRIIVIVLVILVGIIALLHERFAHGAAPMPVGGHSLIVPAPSFRLLDSHDALGDRRFLRGQPAVVTIRAVSSAH